MVGNQTSRILCSSFNNKRSFFKPINACCSSTQPFLEAVNLWSRLSITEQAVAADLPPGFLTSPHVIVPDLELSLKVTIEYNYCIVNVYGFSLKLCHN